MRCRPKRSIFFLPLSVVASVVVATQMRSWGAVVMKNCGRNSRCRERRSSLTLRFT